MEREPAFTGDHAGATAGSGWGFNKTLSAGNCDARDASTASIRLQFPISSSGGTIAGITRSPGDLTGA